MYSKHFGLTADAFFPLSDPEDIFRSSQVRETVQHFFYARRNHHALFLLTGEVGTGKTTAMGAVARDLPEGTPVARVSPATSTPGELLDELCQGFGLPRRPRESKPQRLRRMEAAFAHLLAERGRPVLLLDEAHLLPDAVLETVRLLTNLRHGRHPALQVVLVGQPELVERLRASHLRQLRQRITLRYTMLPLTVEETELYLIERLRGAGSRAPHRVFDAEAALAIHAATAGIPREINVVAEQAMMNAFVESSTVVRSSHVQAVETEFGFEGVLHQAPASATAVAEAAPRAAPAERPNRPSPRDTLPVHPRTDTETFRAKDVGLEPKSPPARPANGRAASTTVRRTAVRAWKRAGERPAALRFGLAFLVAGVALAWSTNWLRTEGAAPSTNASTPRETSTTGTEAVVASGTNALSARPAPSEVETTAAAPRPAAASRKGDESNLSDRYPSTLEVESAVPAVVWLGDQRLGVAPGRFSPVPPGRHELRVEAGDGRVYSKSIIVTPGSTTYVRARALSP